MASLFQGADHAAAYAKFRPSISKKVIEKVIAYLSECHDGPFKHALDVGCGSGQCTRALSPYFENVQGTDISESQIREAKRRDGTSDNVRYSVSKAECIPFEDHTLQLITACSSFHWFDQEPFLEAVQRKLEVNGVLALIGNTLQYIKGNDEAQSERLKDISDKFHFGYLEKFVDSRIPSAKEMFENLELPLRDVIRDEDIVEVKDLPFKEYLAYLTTLSSYQHLIRVEGREAAETLLEKVEEQFLRELQSTSGEVELVVTITRWPSLLMGRK